MGGFVNHGSTRTVWFKRIVIGGEMDTDIDTCIPVDMLPRGLVKVDPVFSVDAEGKIVDNDKCFKTLSVNQVKLPIDLPDAWHTGDRNSIHVGVFKGLALEALGYLSREGYQYVHNLILRQSSYAGQFKKTALIASAKKYNFGGKDGEADQRATGS